MHVSMVRFGKDLQIFFSVKEVRFLSLVLFLNIEFSFCLVFCVDMKFRERLVYLSVQYYSIKVVQSVLMCLF